MDGEISVEPTETEEKLTESEKKLRNIEIIIGLPIKLSEVEKDKFTETFNALKAWMDDAQSAVLEMDRDAAYRYIRLLIARLKQTDVDFAAGVDPSAKASRLETRPEEQEPQEAPVPVVRPTKEQVDGWLDDMTPNAKIQASELDCMKQYLDPEGPGIDIICNHCSKMELAQCIRNEDPTFDDAGSIFMKVQLE